MAPGEFAANFDTTFLVDLRRGLPAAVAKARAFDASGEPGCVTPPAAAEFLVAAHRIGGVAMARTRELLGSLIWLEMDRESCEEAGRIGADLVSRGESIGAMDLLIAALSKRHGQRLVTRDQGFARVRGLAVETY